MSDVLSQPAAHALARALGHFVWQGAAIALVMLVAFRLFRASASARYLAGVAGLAAMLLAPVVTFALLANAPQPAIVGASQQPVGASISTIDAPASGAAAAASNAGQSSPIDWQAAVLLAWLVGASAFTLRLTGGWIVARRFASRAVQPASEHISDMVQHLARRMDVRRAIAVFESHAVSVPVMMGWLKPTIVLPIAALANLNPAQVEALIAHELAHVKRHDYLVNLLQSTIEALLFYHPAVWWLSRRVRAERELCCDDLAVGVCDRLVYATALTDLASLTSPGIALAATDGDLLGRVRRILGRGQTSPAAWPGVAPIIALAFVAAIGIPTARAMSATPQHPGTVAFTPMGEEAGASPTVPQTTPTQSPKPSASPSPSPKPPTSEIAAIEQEIARQKLAEQEELRKRLVELQRQIEAITSQTAMNQAQAEERVKRDIEQNKLAREAELKAVQQDLERMKALQEKGLVSQSQVAEIKAAMDRAAAQGDEVATRSAQLREAQIKLERGKTLAEKGLISSAALGEMERVVLDAQSQLLAAQQAREYQAQIAAQWKAATAPSQTDAWALYDQLEAKKTRVLVPDSASPVQVRDTLTITVAGEPDLPKMHIVGEDGTIRLPFVGSIKVAGLTAAQAREAIGKKLAEKKLGSVDQVTVTIIRPYPIR